MSASVVLSEATGRLLHSADVHPVDSDRDPVVDRVLDRPGLGVGSHRARCHHRAHHDHPGGHITQKHDAGVLYDGD